MYYIFAFTIIYIIAAAIAELLKKKIDFTIPISIIAIALIIYPFGFFKHLEIGVYAVYIISILCALYLLIQFILSIVHREYKYFFKRLLTPGILVYILFWGLFIYINRLRILSSWDEFSHWGLVVKNMFYFDTFGTNPETIVLFRTYPPFTAILEYFFLKIRGAYVEGSIIITMNILYISLLLPILNKIEWNKSIVKLLIYVPFIFLLPLCLYSSFYTTIYVDTILGIMMAYVLYCYFSITDKKMKYLSIIMGLLALVLTKESGIGISILTLIIILADILLQKKLNKIDKKQFKRIVILFSILILCVLIGKYSWNIHLKMSNVPIQSKADGISIHKILNLIKGNANEYQYTILNNFIEQFFNKPLNINVGELTNFALLLIYTLYSMYLIHTIKNNGENDEYKKYKSTCIMLVICYILYMLYLLILYIFGFSEYEGVNLASYERYTATFLLGMFAFNSIILLNYLKTNKVEILTFIILLLLMKPANITKNLIIEKDKSIEQVTEFRKEYSDICTYKPILEKTNQKIYCITSGNDGMDINILRYEILPYTLTATDKYWGSWSLGKPRYNGDIWSADISVEEWSNILLEEDYGYVYIFKADNIFKEKYYTLFKDKKYIKDKTMYKVNVNNGNIELLEIKN